MPEWDVSIPDKLRRNCREFAAHNAIIFAGRPTTFAQLDKCSDWIAAGLARRGIQKGDPVGLYCVNSDTFAIAYFGIVKAGAVVVPINLLLNPKEIVFILNDAGAKALFYHDAFAPALPTIRAGASGLALRICIGVNRAAPDDLLFSELLAADGTAPDVAFDPSTDLAAILYTSGTTGRPKGAMLTHRNLSANAWSIKEALRLIPGEDVFLVVLPMFHAFAATACMLFPALYGCTMVPLPKFDPPQVADAIAAHRVTIFLAVPSMYNAMLHLPAEYTPKLASLKFGISGGAAMPVAVMRRFEERFGKPIYEGDGPTECSPATAVNPIGGARKPATIGGPIPLVEMKIVDEHGAELPDGQVGEIVVRGPNVMKGYWGLPEDTRAAFFGEWFRTGDLGTRDADGYFAIVDRKKDMVIVNGMNVYPRIVEECLYQFPPIREAAVIGEPDERHGEIPVAYVALKPDAATTPAAIRAFCRENLGRHEIPRKVFIVPELPKNAAGKIMKRELRKHGELERGIDSRRPESG